MNLSWLDDFLTLAAICNFFRAADERHMTQPAFGLEPRTTIGPIQLISDVYKRCEALLLQSQVQFVLSHALERIRWESSV